MSVRKAVNNVWLMSNSKDGAAQDVVDHAGLVQGEVVDVDVQEHEARPCCCEFGLHGHAQIFQRALGRRIL
jgi:hypothetical protein